MVHVKCFARTIDFSLYPIVMIGSFYDVARRPVDRFEVYERWKPIVKKDFFDSDD